MSLNKKRVSHTVHALDILYLFMLALAFYFLYVSRRDEVLTVWGVIHPAFIPTLVVATFLLLTIIFSAERVEYKLLFTILHSIISHSLMVIIFPAGNIGAQQTVLGQTRLVFDNIIFHGFGSTRQSLPSILYESFRGENLQAAFSVMFARMLSVDVYWSHLLLVPLLWGTFVPLIAFMISKTLTGNQKISVLAGLATSLFPTTIIWGSSSISNGLSYLFFFCFLFFLLRHFKNNESKDLILVLTFLLASVMSHFLAGTIAISLFFLAYSVKTYENEKSNSPMGAKFTLFSSFILSASILPLALIYRQFFYSSSNTQFSLQKLFELTPTNMILSLLLGRYFDLISTQAYITTLIFGIPAMVGLVTLIIVLRASLRKTSKGSVNPLVFFVLLGLLLIAVEDRVIYLFMVNVPFTEIDRLWTFRDFLLVSFVALFISGAIWETQSFFNRVTKNVFSAWRKAPSAFKLSKAFSRLGHGHLVKGVSIGTVLAYVLILLLASGWVSASVFYAYPHWSPLQTTSYELEAVRYIEETTKQKYIVCGDQWIILAGQMFVGINNPRAFYFSHTDPRGISLFISMKNNPSNETLSEAMKTNNATIAYFIIEKPRLGAETYAHIIEQAQLNKLPTYKIFYYPESEETLRIFFYEG